MKLNGIGASDGFAIGKVYKHEQIALEVTKCQVDHTEQEIEKFNEALRKSIAELSRIQEKTALAMDEESGAIFGAHIEILKDPELINGVVDKINTESINCEYAVKEITDMYIGMFEAMEDAYFRERAFDLKDVAKRVIRNLLGIAEHDLSKIDQEVIVVAEDLTPSDTAGLDKKYVKGFITNVGGRTSHSAIMARTMEIPAVVGSKNAFQTLDHGDLVIVDGFSGEIYKNPNQEMLEDYQLKLAQYKHEKQVWSKLKDQPSTTLDGVHFELASNIGSPEDVEGVLDSGSEGIGLYRTEFLYMESNQLPTEEEQFQAYKTVLEKMDHKPVVIRTLDIGGDKSLPYLEMPHELNPFLGNRAIRLCLEQRDLFKTQLRALLRASVYGNLKIMFPMIATVDEFLEAKAFLMEIKASLVGEGIAVSNSFEVGIMVEIPATVFLADCFAKVVDFFSIGTNDLIQYTFAADRMNEKVSYLYQPLNPALLRMINQVILAAHKEKKWVGMCGEMAGDIKALPLLLGMGLDEFSMSATSVLKARYHMSLMKIKDTKDLVEAALQLSTEKEVMVLVDQFLDHIQST